MSSSRDDDIRERYSISYESPNNESKNNSRKNFSISIVMLLGWNVFTISSVYFSIKFIETPFVNDFQNYFSISFMISNIFFLGHAIYFQKSANMSRRIVISLCSLTLIFMATAITTQIKLFTPDGYFCFIILLMFLSGAFTAYLQNGVFSVVSQFSPMYMQAVMSGQGLAGIIVAILEILSAIIIENKHTPTEAELSQITLAYFIFAMLISLLSLISYFILTRSPLYLHYIPPQEKPIIHPIDQTLNNHSIQRTFNRIRLLCFAIFFNFLVTLALYPSITASIKSTTTDQNKQLFQQNYLFIPIHFLIFNAGDWIEVGIHGKRLVPLLITNDWIYFLILVLFAITNGYLGSLTMMAGPQVFGVVKDFAGTLLSFFLAFGLVCGSMFSFPLKAISCGCNPFAM
ncbi:8898_t:CDS:2 [Scutellospora calospora]|uniref:8898_t:CDS:1 n=1 Tax=Scutellospora calospora TaxID=85575 RepID=A0ACA9K4B9_9GLOM|nr:8898_t:CDS:2 [Scutellospora calospora]